MFRTPPAPPTDVCQNCGTRTQGNYCHECGQQSIQHSLALRPMLADLINELFGYDSKLLRTLRPLMLRPGFLSSEYVAGRRVRYVPPFRLYFFLSVLFFLVLTLYQPNANVINFGDDSAGTKQASSTASVPVKPAASKKDSGKIANVAVSPKSKTPKRIHIGYTQGNNDEFSLDPATLPPTIAEYDRQQADPANPHKHSFWLRLLAHRLIRSKQVGQKTIALHFFDNLPRMMFVLLPVFALLLKIIYIRSRRCYIEHLIFSLHCHCFVFLLLTVFSLVAIKFTHPLLAICVWLWIAVYLYVAMRVVYRQSYLKTFFKYCLLAFFYLVIFLFCLVGTAAVTFLSV